MKERSEPKPLSSWRDGKLVESDRKDEKGGGGTVKEATKDFVVNANVVNHNHWKELQRRMRSTLWIMESPKSSLAGINYCIPNKPLQSRISASPAYEIHQSKSTLETISCMQSSLNHLFSHLKANYYADLTIHSSSYQEVLMLNPTGSQVFWCKRSARPTA